LLVMSGGIMSGGQSDYENRIVGITTASSIPVQSTPPSRLFAPRLVTWMSTVCEVKPIGSTVAVVIPTILFS